GVDEEDRPPSGESPRRRIQAESPLDAAGEKAALAGEKQEGENPDERRQRHRQGEQTRQHPAPGKLRAGEEEGERHPERRRRCDRGEGYPKTAPEDATLLAAA